MQRTITLAGILAVLACMDAARAQESERFRLERTDDGYVRMDTRTGAVSVCRERSDQLVCTPAAEGPVAGDNEVAALRARLEGLEARLAALESAGAGAGSGLPSDEEFEKTMGFMERFFRRFMGIVRSFDEEGADGAEKPAPDRT